MGLVPPFYVGARTPKTAVSDPKRGGFSGPKNRHILPSKITQGTYTVMVFLQFFDKITRRITSCFRVESAPLALLHGLHRTENRVKNGSI